MAPQQQQLPPNHGNRTCDIPFPTLEHILPDPYELMSSDDYESYRGKLLAVEKSTGRVIAAVSVDNTPIQQIDDMLRESFAPEQWYLVQGPPKACLMPQATARRNSATGYDQWRTHSGEPREVEESDEDISDDHEPATIEWLKSEGIQAISNPLRLRVLFTWVPLPEKITRGEVRTVLKIFQGDGK